MDTKNLVAIDVHTHAEVSERLPADPKWKEMQEASAQYFKDEGPRPTISQVTAYYRERKMACVIFPVDMESTTGQVRVPNEEVAEVAAANVTACIEETEIADTDPSVRVTIAQALPKTPEKIEQVLQHGTEVGAAGAQCGRHCQCGRCDQLCGCHGL